MRIKKGDSEGKLMSMTILPFDEHCLTNGRAM